MLKTLGITGASMVLDEQEGKTSIEQIFYKTVGNIYGPYTTSCTMLFDTSSTIEFVQSKQLQCLMLDEKAFSLLMEYAKKLNFGLKG